MVDMVSDSAMAVVAVEKTDDEFADGRGFLPFAEAFAETTRFKDASRIDFSMCFCTLSASQCLVMRINTISVHDA